MLVVLVHACACSGLGFTWTHRLLSLLGIILSNSEICCTTSSGDGFLLGRMLPEPTLTLTLPSIHDGTVLDCRVFHPHSLSPSPRAPAWQKHVAVVAHPYALLGGCYDDPVVDAVAATLLRLGFLVATFNFRCGHSSPNPVLIPRLSQPSNRPAKTIPRANEGKEARGASGSAGRTSWTARAERADYMSVVGFISHYAHQLDPFRSARDDAADVTYPSDTPSPSDANRPTSPSSPAQAADGPLPVPPILCLAGYSYGAMITTQLPALDTIHEIFSRPVRDTPAAEIRHRAEHLAAAQNTVLGEARAAAVAAAQAHKQGARSPRKSLGLRVGGDEDNRRSHDSARRSFSSGAEERIRKGVADVVARAKRVPHLHHHKGSMAGKEGADGAADAGGDGEDRSAVTDGDGGGAAASDDRLPPLASPPCYRPAYLLISPLQGVVTNLATMSFPNPFSKRKVKEESTHQASSSNDEPTNNDAQAAPEAERKLVRNPTLAVYGDQDVFVPARKLREWVRRLEGYPDSQFRAHEISTASHFWTEGRVVQLLRDAVQTFAESVLRG